MNARTLSVITGLAASLTLAPCALAVQGCTNSYLNGNYGMQFTGATAPGVANGIGGVAVPASMATSYQQLAANGGSGVAPVAGAARLVLDGQGNITGYSSENLAGQWIQANVSGTYTVNLDCTFVIALTDSSGNAQNFSGVLVSQASAATILQTDAGTGISGTLRALRGFCQNSDISGSFGLQYSGTSLAVGNAAYSSVGVVSFDGQGNLTAAETRFSGGTSSQMQSAGTIVVNPDCSFTLTLVSASPTGGAMNFFGIASADEKQLLIVQSDAATAAIGTVSSQ